MGRVAMDEVSGMSQQRDIDKNKNENNYVNINITERDDSRGSESNRDIESSHNVTFSGDNKKESVSLQEPVAVQNEIHSDNDENKSESESESDISNSESDSVSDSSSEELTDVSEKFEDHQQKLIDLCEKREDGNVDHQVELAAVGKMVEDGKEGNREEQQEATKSNVPDTLNIVPQINVMSATDISMSDDSSTSSNSQTDKRKIKKKKKKKVSKQLHESNTQLQEQFKQCKLLEGQLQEERDAKERVQSNLHELQQKYEHKLKEDEELIKELHKKDELNLILETKELELIQEVINLKREISQNFDNIHDTSTASNDTPSQIHLLNEELKNQLRDMQNKLASSEAILAEKSAHVESLEREIVLLKEKMMSIQKDEKKEISEKERLDAIPSQEIKARVESMVAEVINDSQKKVQVKVLEEEVEELKGKLDTSEAKYAKDMAEALATLKQVQDAYGEMRDIVLEEYKNEVMLLTDRVRIAEENNNENIITGLRQELLDSRLQQERSKLSHEDEKEVQRKTILDSELKQKELLTHVEQLKLDLEAKTEHNKNIQSSLQRNQAIADERKEKISELSAQLNEVNSDTENMKGSIITKDEEIVQLKEQLAQADDIAGKDLAEREALQMEVDVMESVKRQNQRLEDEVEEMSHKLKLRNTKIKFLKKHIKELERQQQKAEGVMSAIPEMQQKIDQLSEEKAKLQQDIANKLQQEEEEKRKIAEEKKLEQIRLQKEKEEWERRTLGIGRCLEIHEDESKIKTDNTVIRPSSAPLLKPHPPSSKRHIIKNTSKSNIACAPTLNPTFLQSYPEGRKATQKMKQHQEKAMLTQSLTSPSGRFSSVTKPISYANASYKHIARGKNFPNISAKSKNDNGGFSPRVLVWGDGEGAGNKMLAVGDHVLTNIHTECSAHGHISKQHPGIVKFIGFVSGNEEDVYVGIRLEEDIGYTDGVIQGKRYFRCEPEKGTFVHLNDIVKVLSTRTNHVPTLMM